MKSLFQFIIKRLKKLLKSKIMFYHLFVFNLLLIVCNSQDHFTCVRTDQVLSTSSSAPTRCKQRPPRKRRRTGLKGNIGAKGSKGEPGISDNSPIRELKEEIKRLRKQVEINTNNITNNNQPFKNLTNGWVVLNNGYQYKLTPQTQPWDESRSICQLWGGDLVVFGVQNMGLRRLLKQVLSIPTVPDFYWIGLNDQAREGRWVWLNGEEAIAQTALWGTNQPNDHNVEDCGAINISNKGSDRACDISYHAVCEK